ncbi:anti-sigma factor antagonist [Streptomyces sp. CAU 1734]
MEPIKTRGDELIITYEHVSEAMTVVKVVGEVDVHSAPALRNVLTDLIALQHIVLVVDMGEADLTDSTGLGVLIGGLKRTLAAGGALAIAAPHRRFLRLLHAKGLAKVFPVAASVAIAVERLPLLVAARRRSRDSGAEDGAGDGGTASGAGAPAAHQSV